MRRHRCYLRTVRALDSLSPRSPQSQQRHLHRVLSSSSPGNSTVASAVAAATGTSPTHACVLAPLHATHASTARGIAFLSPCSSATAPHLQQRQQRHRQPHRYERHHTCRQHQHQHAGHCTSTLAAPCRGPFTARPATMHCQHHAAAVHRQRTINNSNRPDSWGAPTPLTHLQVSATATGVRYRDLTLTTAPASSPDLSRPLARIAAGRADITIALPPSAISTPPLPRQHSPQVRPLALLQKRQLHQHP